MEGLTVTNEAKLGRIVAVSGSQAVMLLDEDARAAKRKDETPLQLGADRKSVV